jgi:hypothetical protein
MISMPKRANPDAVPAAVSDVPDIDTEHVTIPDSMITQPRRVACLDILEV